MSDPKPLPKSPVKMTDADKRVVFHVLENVEEFLTKDRWLKGGWYRPQNEGSTPGLHHSECLGNFIRRVELGGSAEDAKSEASDYGDTEQQTWTEQIVGRAIAHEFPDEQVRHVYMKDYKADEYAASGAAFIIVDPKECTLGDGTQCHTCRTRMLPNEKALEMHYGGYRGGSIDTIVQFNDAMGTTYGDVKRVIATARKIIQPTTVAGEVMTPDEKLAIEMASLDAQAEIDKEKLDEWLDGLAAKGWLSAKKAQNRAKKRMRKIDQETEAEKKALRQDCVNCTE